MAPISGRTPARVPDWMRAQVHRKVEALSRTERLVLSYAALLGHRFDDAVLRVAVGCENRVLDGALENLIDGGFIEEDAFEGSGFRFRHAIVRELLCEALPIAVARRRHAKILAALEALPNGDRRLDQLVYHAFEAARTKEALAYSERVAAGLFDFATADRLFAQLANPGELAPRSRSFFC